MANKPSGASGRWRRRSWILLLGLAAAALVSSLVYAVTTGVDGTGLFALDGDANTGNANSNYGNSSEDDWQFLVTNNGSSNSNFGTWTGIVLDPTPDPTTFTTGGSKDINDISQWRWTAGSVPDKDNILHAYAAAYTAPSSSDGITQGDLLIFFGADRLANNGDAQLGFWFLQGQVAPQAGGTFGPAAHSNGDILVLADFTSGGQVASFEVLEWQSGSLVVKLAPSTTACENGSVTTACASSNTAPAQLYWAYTPKFPVKGKFPQGTCTSSANCAPVASFFEGGIDVTAILGSTPCFTTFIAETRSSSSVSAQLEDFVLGSFNLCGFQVTKQCFTPSVSPDGTSLRYPFGGAIQNTGAGTLTNVTITDTFPADATNIGGNGTCNPSNVCTFVIASIAKGACVEWPSGNPCTNQFPSDQPATDFSTTFDTTTNGPSNIVSAATANNGGVTGTGPGGGPLPTATCPAGPGASITVTKACLTSLGSTFPASPTVSFTGQVCNTSPFVISNLTGTDIQTDPTFASNLGSGGTVTFAGNVTTLQPMGQTGACVDFTGSYTPTQVSGGTDACSYSFADKVSISGTFLGSQVVSNTGTATCPLCNCSGSILSAPVRLPTKQKPH